MKKCFVKIVVLIVCILVTQSIVFSYHYQPPIERAMERAAVNQYMNDINSGNMQLQHTQQIKFGWNNLNGLWIYRNNDYTYYGYEEYAKGWCKIDGDWYYFDNDSFIMASNCVIDGFQLGIDGKLIKTEIEPNGMDYDTTYSFLKTVNVNSIENEYIDKSKDIFIANNLKIVKNEFVTIHKPIFAGKNGTEVNDLNAQFDEMFEGILEENLDFDEIIEKTDILTKIDSITRRNMIIKIEKRSGNDLSSNIVETLYFDREEKNLMTYSEYWADK